MGLPFISLENTYSIFCWQVPFAKCAHSSGAGGCGLETTEWEIGRNGPDMVWGMTPEVGLYHQWSWWFGGWFMALGLPRWFLVCFFNGKSTMGIDREKMSYFRGSGFRNDISRYLGQAGAPTKLLYEPNSQGSNFCMWVCLKIGLVILTN